MRKLIVRIKGGLGNQLFCYAAARRLALVNDAELVLDTVTGFARDYQYRRQYALDNFLIPCRKATPQERMEPLERVSRGIVKFMSQKKPFEKRFYLEQEGVEFDSRLLDLKITGTRYIEGYWQSESYFKDIEPTIRKDLTFVPPKDVLNHNLKEKILSGNAVALHVRWFDSPGTARAHNVSVMYYRRAIEYIEQKVCSPHFFLFSDDPGSAFSQLPLSGRQVTVINHNNASAMAYADMWLMTHCRHFITANSTFSWWGAWLASNVDKIVVAPCVKLSGITSWGFRGLIPNDWITLENK
jgi:hypothetical protein